MKMHVETVAHTRTNAVCQVHRMSCSPGVLLTCELRNRCPEQRVSHC